MLINEQTKISALLKHNFEALEAIVSISPDFKKLRNPLLRKLMAGRTSIAMASKIGGCKPEDFYKVLLPLGFEVDKQSPVQEEEERKPVPEYLKSVKEEQIITFDVREMLAGGTDPLKAIQEKVKALTNGQVLVIVNTFEPVPLIKLLEKQGFETYVNVIEEKIIETYFYKKSHEKTTELANPIAQPTDGWEAILQSYQGKLVEVDVRHMEMPMPMMTILEALENLPQGQALYVHHKRIPVFLLTELKDRGFEYRIHEIGEQEVYLLIFK